MLLSSTPLDIADPRGFLRTRFLARRGGTGLADNVLVGECLRSGSNNEVHVASFRGSGGKKGSDASAFPLAVRRPLSDSDTRKASQAT